MGFNRVAYIGVVCHLDFWITLTKYLLTDKEYLMILQVTVDYWYPLKNLEDHFSNMINNYTCLTSEDSRHRESILLQF